MPSIEKMKNKWRKAFKEEKAFVTTCGLYDSEEYTPDFHDNIFDITVAAKGAFPTPFVTVFDKVYHKHYDQRSALAKFLTNPVSEEVNEGAADYFNRAFEAEARLRLRKPYAPQVTCKDEVPKEQSSQCVYFVEHAPSIIARAPKPIV